MLKNKFVLVLTILWLGLTAASAQPLDAFISSGGTVEPNFIDIKGEPVIGSGTAGGTKLEIGGIYVIAAPAGTLQIAITRSGSDIVLTWDSAENPNIDIYALSSAPGAAATGIFDNTIGWTLLAGNQTGGTYTDAGQVGAGVAERYYKALIAGTPPTAVPPDGIGTFLSRAPAVGKVNLAVSANGLSLAGIPVEDGNVSTIFPPQLAAGNVLNLYPRVGQGLDKVTATSSGITGTNFSVGPGVGFWVENPGAVPLVITFAGGLPALLDRALERLDLTGNPLPFGLNSADLGGEAGDIVYPQVGRGLDKITRAAVWRAFTLQINQGFWFEYASDTRRWLINPYLLDARIVR